MSEHRFGRMPLLEAGCDEVLSSTWPLWQILLLALKR